MEPWLSFYLKHFGSMDDAEAFVTKCELLQPSVLNHVAKVMMHQTQRLVSISDKLPQLFPHEEPLQVMFLVMCAENISKLHDGFSSEGRSRYYVDRFFEGYLSQTDKDALALGFKKNEDNLPPIGFEGAVELLYDIRCSVVHEGNYVSFAFHDGQMPMVNADPNVIAEISLGVVRDIVVRGCITAIREKLSDH